MAQFLEGGLTKPCVEDLQGTRCRLQRLRDMKFLSGWVKDAAGQQITIELKEPLASAEGEKFNLEAATGEVNVAYPCALVAVDGVSYELQVTGEALITTPGQEPRYRAYHIEVALMGAESWIQTQAIDISASGIGLLTFDQLPRFAPVRLSVRNAVNAVECCGTVRYCRPDQTHKGCYRIGVQVEFEDRLARAMWLRLVQSTSQTGEKAA